jgi:hypothetical protein
VQVAQQKGCTDGYRVTINDGVNGCKPASVLMHAYMLLLLLLCEMHRIESVAAIRLTFRDGVAGQSVFHLHLHVMGGRQLVSGRYLLHPPYWWILRLLSYDTSAY